MSPTIIPLAAMFRVLALACLICLPAHAEPKVWMGSGQVVSGQGQGATVQLVIETDGGRIRTHSGPHLDATLSGQPQTLETDAGTWHIEPMGDRMGVTLYRGDQIIRYLLQPASAPPDNAAPSNADTVLPFAPSNTINVVPADNAAPEGTSIGGDSVGGESRPDSTVLEVLEADVVEATDTLLNPVP